MKKLLFIAVVAVASLASCKKDYTCTCITTANGTASPADVTTIYGVSKSAAKANCVDDSRTYTSGGSSVVAVTDCTLN